MQQLLNGVFIGSIYALFAIGFTLVFGILDRLNLAHPSVFAVSAFVGIELVADGRPVHLAGAADRAPRRSGARAHHRAARLPAAEEPTRCPLRGADLVDRARRDVHRPVAVALRPRHPPLPGRVVPGDTSPVRRRSVTVLQVAILFISVVLMVGLSWLVARSRLGRAMRAIAENPRAARVLGVNVDRVTALTFAISSALGAVAGALFAMNVNSAQLGMGSAIELKGLAVIIVGGMGSLPGALVGGLVLGLAEVFAVQYIGSSWRDLIAFGLLFVILLVRPQGLFGSRKVREV